jgi:hypothetical protein
LWQRWLQESGWIEKMAGSRPGKALQAAEIKELAKGA